MSLARLAPLLEPQRSDHGAGSGGTRKSPGAAETSDSVTDDKCRENHGQKRNRELKKRAQEGWFLMRHCLGHW